MPRGGCHGRRLDGRVQPPAPRRLRPVTDALVGLGAGRWSATFGSQPLGVTRHGRASLSPLAHDQHRAVRPPEDLLGQARPEDPLKPRTPLTLGHDQTGVDLFAEADDLLFRPPLPVVGRREGTPELLFYPPRLII
jgi:hypothetical protein